MTTVFRVLAFVVAALSVTSCAPRGPIQTPETVTMPLDKSIQAVVQALDALVDQREQQVQNDPDTPLHGLVPSEVEVVLQLTSGGTETLNASFQVFDSGAGWSSETVHTTGNTIRVRLRNVVFATREEMLALKEVSEIRAIVKELIQLGISPPVGLQ